MTKNNNKIIWFIWAIASGFVLYRYLLLVSPSVLSHELMQAFQLNGAKFGILAASYFYAYLLMQLPVGILLDRFSARYLIAFAILMCAAAAFLLAITTRTPVAIFSRVLLGFFGAFSAVGTMKLVMLLFPRQYFPILSGLMMTIAMVGAIFGQAPLAFSAELIGWRQTLMLLTLFGVLLSVAFFSLSKNLSQHHQASEQMSIKQIFSGLISLTKEKNNWLIALYSGLAFAPVSAYAGLWGIPFLLQKYGLTKPQTASIVSLCFVGIAIGCPLSGWISNLLRRRKLIMLTGSSLAAAILLVILFWRTTPFILSLLHLLFGFFISFFFVSFTYITEYNPPENSGVSLGFMNMFNALFGALSEPMIGKLLDHYWNGKMVNGVHLFSTASYQNALLLLPIGLLIAVILASFCIETYAKPR